MDLLGHVAQEGSDEEASHRGRHRQDATWHAQTMLLAGMPTSLTTSPPAHTKPSEYAALPFNRADPFGTAQIERQALSTAFIRVHGRLRAMRTALILASGLLLLMAFVIFSRLFTQHYPSAPTWAVGTFLAAWLAATGFNFWVGVNKAGYSVSEELPIMLVLFGVPAIAALLIRWKFT